MALVAAGVAWERSEGGSTHPLTWKDVTSQLGPVPWPKPVTRTFWKPGQLARYLRRSVPRNAPRAIAIDYTRRRAVLVAAGPRSSSGYSVRVLRVTQRADRIEVIVREQTPSVADRVRPGLTFPYRLITIPATSKRVYVRWEGRP